MKTIEKISDDINVGIYIKPMKLNISFGVKFLEDTMILIEEGTIDGENKEVVSAKNISSYLPSNNSNNNLSVWKIAVVTAFLSTLFNVITFGAIYLCIKRKKKKVSVKAD